MRLISLHPFRQPKKKEYVSFQFDEKRWDLSGNRILVLPNFFPRTVIPVVDHNVRLLELPNPPHPYTAQFALDNPAITVRSRETADYDDNGLIEVGDLNLVLFNWNQDGGALPASWVNSRPAAGVVVGMEQLNAVLFDWGNSAETATVPEPVNGWSVWLPVWAACLSCSSGSAGRSLSPPIGTGRRKWSNGVIGQFLSRALESHVKRRRS